MKVDVYVEGPSDRDALRALLAPLIAEGQGRGVGIRFLPQGGKAPILHDVPRKAAERLLESAEDWVIALPDLYPMACYDDGPNAHRSFGDLERLLRGRFLSRAEKIRLPEAAHRRFRVHCLQHDLEALVLAATDVLRRRLGTTDTLRGGWRIPVEDQNDRRPPKRVVEELFDRYRKKPGYQDTIDAVWILERASLEGVEKACSRRFAGFVAELRDIVSGRTPRDTTQASAPKPPAGTRRRR